MLLNFSKHSSGCLCFSISKIYLLKRINLRFCYLLNKLVALVFHFLSKRDLIFFTKFSALYDTVYLVFNVAIAFFEEVCLCSKHINIVVKTVVLFFRFNEWSYNLVYGGNTCGVFNLLEGVFNDFNISEVLVHQSFLLLFFFDYFIDYYYK